MSWAQPQYLVETDWLAQHLGDANVRVLTLLGEANVAVYDASLSEWAADPSLPMERD